MAGGGDGKFGCPSCGKRYSWKPEMAGKKAKCKCGAVISVPASVAAKVAAPPPPPVAAEEPEDLYGFREDEAGICPSCQREMSAGAVICVHCGYNAKTRQHLSTMAGSGEEGGIPPVPGRVEGSPARSALAAAYPVRKKLSDDKPYQTVFNDAWKGYVAIVFALGIMGLGVYWMTDFDPSWFEGGGTRRVRRFMGLIRFLYSIVGKWGLIAIVELIGMMVGFWGWGVATGKIDPDSGDE